MGGGGDTCLGIDGSDNGFRDQLPDGSVTTPLMPAQV